MSVEYDNINLFATSAQTINNFPATNFITARQILQKKFYPIIFVNFTLLPSMTY